MPYDSGMNPIARACEIVGGVSRMAAYLKVSAPTVSQWVSEKRPVPLDHCPFVEQAVGGAVTCEQLRPDKVAYFALLRSRKDQPVTPSPFLVGEGAGA